MERKNNEIVLNGKIKKIKYEGTSQNLVLFKDEELGYIIVGYKKSRYDTDLIVRQLVESGQEVQLNCYVYSYEKMTPSGDSKHLTSLTINRISKLTKSEEN